MIETTGTQEWFVWGVHRTDSPHAAGASPVVVELSAVKEMIRLVAGGHVEERDLVAALDACARRARTAEDAAAVIAADRIVVQGPAAGAPAGQGPRAAAPAGPDGAPAGRWDALPPDRPEDQPYDARQERWDAGSDADPGEPLGEGPDDNPDDHPGDVRDTCRAGCTEGCADGCAGACGDACLAGCTDDCPEGCQVCLGARAEFDAIAAASYTHKVRLSDPELHPYAAEKNTLHRSGCARVARFVGRAEPLGSPQSLAALPAFAHHGVCTTAWAAGMQVMTLEEAVAWARRQVEPPDGAGYKLCRQCLPTVPGTGTSDPWACAPPAEP